MHTLHCYGYPLGKGRWQNRCVEYNLIARGNSFTDAERALDAVILQRTVSGALRKGPAPLRYWAAYYSVKLLNPAVEVLVRHWRRAGAVGARLLTVMCLKAEQH
jgi:hypothetical protein